MVVANNNAFGIFIYNGDFGLVRKVFPEIYKREVFLKYKRGKEEQLQTIRVPLQFKKIEIGFKTLDDKNYFFECFILENILYPNLVYQNTQFKDWVQRDLSSIETRALYVDFVNRARKQGLKQGSEEFKQALKDDNFLIAKDFLG